MIDTDALIRAEFAAARKAASNIFEGQENKAIRKCTYDGAAPYVICPACDGYGAVERVESENITTTIRCTKCLGRRCLKVTLVPA